MPALKLNLDEILVESFPATPEEWANDVVKPNTFEPGCTRDFCRVELVD